MSAMAHRPISDTPAATSASRALLAYARVNPPAPSKIPPKYRVTTQTTLVTFSR